MNAATEEDHSMIHEGVSYAAIPFLPWSYSFFILHMVCFLLLFLVRPAIQQVAPRPGGAERPAIVFNRALAGAAPAQDLKLLATPPLRPNQYLCPLSTQYSAHNNHMPYNLQLKQTTVNPTIDLLLYESGITAPLTSSGRN